MASATSPATKPCVRCRVEINAASGHCTLCGARQRVLRRWLRWVRAVVVLTLVTGAVAGLVVVLTAGGAASGPPQLHRSGEIVALVPAGWTGGRVFAPPPGTVQTSFNDPLNPFAELTVTVERRASAAPPIRAGIARRLARRRGQYREHLFARIRFPDGRPAWLLSYDAYGTYWAAYFFSTCAPPVAMTVAFRANLRTDLPRGLDRFAAAAGAPCGAAGPPTPGPTPGRAPPPVRRGGAAAARPAGGGGRRP
ncbi:MAG: hypothetical protein ACR2KV_09275 [Solirubrobacteraceae bacterium]